MPIEFGVKITKFPPSAAVVEKSIRFGTARGLTTTAQEGQTAVQGALKGAFTLRGKWFMPSNKFGIKIRPARIADKDLVASVYSGADWLEKQEAGGDVFPYKNWLAIPTANVRQKGSTKIISKALRPGNLKNAFVIVTKKTGARLLCVRKGRSRKRYSSSDGIVPMYLLVPKVKVHPVNVFHEPVEKVCERRLHLNLQTGIKQALATMKY